MITRTEFIQPSSDEKVQAEIESMEEAGWAVRQIIPAAWDNYPAGSGYNTKYLVVYERDVE